MASPHIESLRKDGIRRHFLSIQHVDQRRKHLNALLELKSKQLQELGQLSTDYLDIVDRGFHIEKIKTLHFEIKKLLALAIEDNGRKQKIAEKMYNYEESL